MSTSYSSQRKLLDLAYIAVFAALIIVFAFVSIPAGAAGVPIVMQNAVIVLAGLILGARRGFLATALFLTLGLIGLPVLAGGRSVLAALPGPTVGYLVGYLVSVLVAGVVAYNAPKQPKPLAFVSFLVAALLALVTQYALGTLGLMFRAGMDFNKALLVNVPFIGPDVIKMVVAVFIAIGVHAAFPDLRTSFKMK